MKQLFILLLMAIGLFAVFASCKKSEEESDVEEISAYMSDEENFGNAMKKTSRDTRRLARVLEARDWIEIEMWAEELKQGIGVSCVNLYLKNHSGVAAEFIILGDRFYNATNRLILSCKDHDAEMADAQFNKMIKACDGCHERYKKKGNKEGE